MRRSLVAGSMGLALISAACVSVTPAESPVPVATPTSSPTASPALTATSSPTASPAPTPTLVPTLAPTATTPSLPTGSPSTGTGFHTDTEIFTDDFSDPSSVLWGTGSLTEGTIEYVDEELSIVFLQSEASLWSWRLTALGDTPTTWNTLRIAGDVTLEDGDGSAGWACGNSPGDFVGGKVTNDAEWQLFELVASTTSILISGPLPDEISVASFYEVAIECAGTATGFLALRMEVDGVEVATFARPDGASNFDRVAAYASVGAGDFGATFDDAEARGGTEFGGFPEADVDQAALDELLTHVPDAFEANCTPSDEGQEGVLASVRCEPAGAAGQAGYASFVDTASMDAVFDEIVAQFASPEGGSCGTGPNSGTYTIGEIDAGRVVCGPSQEGTGIAIAWTDTQLNILAAGNFGTEDYPALLDWWLNDAGPDR